jgi:putative membrane protein
MPTSHKIIYAVYLLVWILSAINPKYPQDWLLENILVFLFFPVVVWLDRKYRFSDLSLILLLIFASLHSLGAHYTYAEMEYFKPVMQLLGLERNDFDRVVHFLFGLLTFRIIFELITPKVKSWGAALFFTFMTIAGISAIYELLEWGAAVTLHPDLGMAFLGTQGDVWDAHKDMLMAKIGAAINLLFYPYYRSFFYQLQRKES